MSQYHTGTIYIFQEEGTGHLIFKTTDIRVLLQATPSQTIAIGETMQHKGIQYIVENFEIEVSSHPPTLDIPHSMQEGENNPFGIHTLIYLKKKVYPPPP